MTRILTTRNGGLLVIPPETAEHLEVHERQVEGYRPITELLEELATRLDLPMDGSLVLRLVDFGRPVGRTGAIRHGAIDGRDELLAFAYRNGRAFPTRVSPIGIRGAEVTTLVVVATVIAGREAEGAYTLRTAYPADFISPREPMDPTLPAQELDESLAWWSRNALLHDPEVMGQVFYSTWNEVLCKAPESTEHVTLTLGVTAGYGHANEGAIDEVVTLKAVVEAGIRLANQVNAEIGLYPSFVASPARVGYKHEWGCPEGGEFVVAFSGTRNPEFAKNSAQYVAAWRRLACLLKKEFGQTTATLEVTRVGLAYLK